MSVTHHTAVPGPAERRGSVGPRDGAGLAGFLLALTASLSVWVAVIALVLHVLL
ncbi:MAG: hypothetical protein Q7T56_00275 [Nocardioidaceae bacterium]|nr:hypothetical protein [Nocardioidaceae bacterium]